MMRCPTRKTPIGFFATHLPVRNFLTGRCPARPRRGGRATPKGWGLSHRVAAPACGAAGGCKGGAAAPSSRPKRSLSKLMNKVITHPYFEYIETMLKSDNDYRSVHRVSDYDERIKVWMMVGGDNERWATLAQLEEMSHFEKI